MLALAVETFSKIKNIILIGGKAPVAFFAYPGNPSECYQPGTRIFTLARADEDISYALEALAHAVDAERTTAPVSKFSIPVRPKGDITPEKIGHLIAATLPKNAIVVDESVSTGRNFVTVAQTAHPMTGSCLLEVQLATRCLWQSAPLLPARTGKLSASKAMAAVCTCRKHCGRRRARD
jgi:hypothetical protein